MDFIYAYSIDSMIALVFGGLLWVTALSLWDTLGKKGKR